MGSLFSAIPVIGPDLVQWIQGDYVISGATLNRFFALHVIALPLVIVILVFLHIIAIHEYYTSKYDIADDVLPFFPHIVLKDLVAFCVFLALFTYVLFFAPEMGGKFLEHPNFEIANPLKTPEHIFPVWYFTPFYAILKAVPDKLFGVLAMFGAIAALFALPWLD